MTRRFRKLSVSATIVAVAILTAACGSSTHSASQGASKGSTNVTSPSSGSGAGPTIDIGAVLPLSGSGAIYGQEDQKMIELAATNISKSHLINGKLAIHYCDSQALPAPAVACAEKAATINHAVALQTLFTAPVAAEVPVANRYHMLEVNVGASGPNLDGLSPQLVTVLPLGNQQIATYAKWAVQQGYKRWVVLYTTESLGEGLLKAIQSDVPSDGGTVAKAVSVSPDATNYASAENLIQNAVGSQSGKTIVYFAVSGLVSGNVQSIISALAAQGVHAQWASYNGSITPAIQKDAAAAGFEYTAPNVNLASTNSVTTQFMSTYKATYPNLKMLDYFTEDYNGLWLIGDAIHYVQTHNEKLTGTNLAQALLKMGTVDVVGGSYAVQPGGTVSIPIAVLKMGSDGSSSTVYAGK